MNRRLSSDDVMFLRSEYARGEFDQIALARAYGVSQQAISDAISGVTHSHLPLIAQTGNGASAKALLNSGGKALTYRPGYTPAALYRQDVVRRAIARWIDARLSLDREASIQRYRENLYRNKYATPFVPNDKLCWCLTFEMMLRRLPASHYRSLVKWYRVSSRPPQASIDALYYEMFSHGVR